MVKGVLALFSGSADGGGYRESDIPMPDRCKVIRYLESQRSNMEFQGSIREEFEWSDAKTSNILCKMEDNQEISRFRKGNRKVVRLSTDDGREV